MKIAITGSTGLVGSQLVEALLARGDKVLRLVRGAPRGAEEVRWDPESGVPDVAALEELDGIVHLAGESIAARRWSAAQKERIKKSRTQGTTALVSSLSKLRRPPGAFVSASAIGFYGDTGDRKVDETARPGSGFLPEVCRAWEDASKPMEAQGSRVAHLRFGMILSPEGGALKKMLLPFKLGVGGVVGSGKQGTSWVSLRDVVSAIPYALERDLSGPVNVVAPGACTNREFTKALGGALGRPTILPLPAFAARLAFGELADELLLASAWVQPAVLERAGFRFQDREIGAVLARMLRRGGA